MTIKTYFDVEWFGPVLDPSGRPGKEEGESYFFLVIIQKQKPIVVGGA